MDIYCVIVVGNKQEQTKTIDGSGKHPNWTNYNYIWQFKTFSNQENIKIYIKDEDPGQDDLVAYGTIDTHCLTN